LTIASVRGNSGPKKKKIDEEIKKRSQLRCGDVAFSVPPDGSRRAWHRRKNQGRSSSMRSRRAGPESSSAVPRRIRLSRIIPRERRSSHEFSQRFRSAYRRRISRKSTHQICRRASPVHIRYSNIWLTRKKPDCCTQIHSTTRKSFHALKTTCPPDSSMRSTSPDCGAGRGGAANAIARAGRPRLRARIVNRFGQMARDHCREIVPRSTVSRSKVL